MKKNDSLQKIYVTLLAFKKVLSMSDAEAYTGLGKSRLYQATREKELPYYKNHGRVYFKREDLEAWMTQNRVSSTEEIETKALNHVISKL